MKKDYFIFIFLQAESALMYDSVLVFATGLQTLEQSHTLRVSNISCEAEVPWDGGLSLINYINSVKSKSVLLIFRFISSHEFINNVIFGCTSFGLVPI